MIEAAPKVNQIEIKVNGQHLPHDLMDVLLDAEIDSSLMLPDMFMLRFHDDRAKWVDQSPFELGASVEVRLRHRDTEKFSTVMRGEVTAIEADFDNALATLTIRGYDKTHRLNRGTKTRVFVQASDGDIIKKVCGESGLSAVVEATPLVRAHVFQDNQTDLEFLQMLATRNGFEIAVDDQTATKLHFRKPVGQGEVDLKWGTSLVTFRPRLSLAGQVDEVIVKGWDPAAKKAIIGTARSSSSHPQIGESNWGGALAKSKFSSAAKYVEVRHPVATQDEAQKYAQLLLDEINASFVEAEGVAKGHPELLAGVKVKINYVGRRFSGNYVITAARHTYAPDGYHTSFVVEGIRPKTLPDLMGTTNDHSLRATNMWTGVVPALVTNINDPDKQGRVKLKYPWLDDQLESDWARVAGVGAGKNRGLYVMPEVNDEVLVAFEYGDFNRPYVIGGLWNKPDTPPETDAIVKGVVNKRTWKSRAGHIIRFVDDSAGEKIEIIDCKNGTTITLDAKAKKLEIQNQGGIDITTKGNMNLKATGTMNIESNGALTIKSNTTGKVEAGAVLEVKGAVVKIN